VIRVLGLKLALMLPISLSRKNRTEMNKAPGSGTELLVCLSLEARLDSNTKVISYAEHQCYTIVSDQTLSG
jgi:hypothetical protein